MTSPSPTRLIVLTGCTRGLGAALARAFDAGGHLIVGCGRSEAGIAALRAELPRRHHFSVVDVTDPLAVDGWARVVQHELGVPDLLVNNAAVINDPAPLWEIAPDEIAALLEVNILGICHVLRAFLPPMRQRQRGVVVNLSSGAGRVGLPGLAPYCATKWAVEGLTKSLAAELPDGMAAIPLSPGAVNTDMLRQIWGERAAAEPDPAAWARLAAPYILALGPEHNGASLTVPR
jgi:NAD(P)-dependent dehydrogenase (short-subunit alcohol dehydrogenase family)